jgi:hypothetical protein
VKTAVADGATTTAAIARATGLDPLVVTAITAELERIGELVVDHIGFGCPDGACGSCDSGAECTSPKDPAAVTFGATRRRD